MGWVRFGSKGKNVSENIRILSSAPQSPQLQVTAMVVGIPTILLIGFREKSDI